MALAVRYDCDGEAVDTTISDLSVNGAFVDTPDPLSTGSLLTLVFTLPDGMVVETLGKVVHSQAGVGMGITFTTLSSEQSNYIRQFIRA
jgi:hypothetical protein